KGSRAKQSTSSQTPTCDEQPHDHYRKCSDANHVAWSSHISYGGEQARHHVRRAVAKNRRVPDAAAPHLALRQQVRRRAESFWINRRTSQHQVSEVPVPAEKQSAGQSGCDGS